MTTIAYDGKSISADGRLTFGERGEVATESHLKLHYIGDAYIIGISGDPEYLKSVVTQLETALITEGRDPEGLELGHEDKYSVLLVDRFSGDCYEQHSFSLLKITGPTAIGTGGCYARLAMEFFGADSETAVRAAASRDIHTNANVTTIPIERSHYYEDIPF